MVAVASLLSFSSFAVVPSGATSSLSQARVTGHQVIFPTKHWWAATHTNGNQTHKSSSNTSGSGLLYAHGGSPEVVIGTPKVYLVFYGSQWGTMSTTPAGYAAFSGDPSGMAPQIQSMLAGVGTNGETWSGVMTQYCDGVASGTTSCAASATHTGVPTSSGALTGVWYDNSTASPSAATQTQLATEAAAAAGHFGNTTTTLNRSAQYIVVSPTGTHPAGFNTPNGNFCAWHSYASSSNGNFAFTNLPYVPDMGASCGANYVNAGGAGLLDGVTIVEGHEYAETLTDQSASGGWLDSAGYENGDKCAWVGQGGTGGAQDVAFLTGSFAMQATWSNDANGCQISHPIISDQPDFTVSASPSSGSVVQAGAAISSTISTSTIGTTSQSVVLSVSGAPVGVTATLSPSTVTSGGSSTLSISAAAGAASGTYPLTISGVGTSMTHSIVYSLTVGTPVKNDFSISITPSTGTATRQGSAITATVSTSTISGVSQIVTLKISGAPSGVSTSLATSSISSGGSTTLRLSAGRKATPGTYKITVTGTAASGNHAATYTLTVK